MFSLPIGSTKYASNDTALLPLSPARIRRRELSCVHRLTNVVVVDYPQHSGDAADGSLTRMPICLMAARAPYSDGDRSLPCPSSSVSRSCCPVSYSNRYIDRSYTGGMRMLSEHAKERSLQHQSGRVERVLRQQSKNVNDAERKCGLFSEAEWA